MNDPKLTRSLILLATLAYAPAALAYLDPGTGSMIMSAIIGLFATAALAIKTGFGKKPVFMKEGGSIPIVADFKKILGVNTVLIGFAQSDDNVHSPNERMRVVDFERGCKAAAALPAEMAKVKK